jgi:hypothetical protein
MRVEIGEIRCVFEESARGEDRRWHIYPPRLSHSGRNQDGVAVRARASSLARDLPRTGICSYRENLLLRAQME